MPWKQDEQNLTVIQNVKVHETKILCPIWKTQWKRRQFKIFNLGKLPVKGILQGREETTHDRYKDSFQSPFLPALAFSSASLTSSRESERAEQHHAAQTLHKQKTQPRSASGTAPSTDFPQMAKGDLLSPLRSSLLSLAPPCRDRAHTGHELQFLCVTWAGSGRRQQGLYHPVQKPCPCHQMQGQEDTQYLPEEGSGGSQHLSLGWVGRSLKHGQRHFPLDQQTSSNLVLDICRDAAYTDSPGILHHCLITPTGKNFFPIFNPNQLSVSSHNPLSYHFCVTCPTMPL